LTQAANVGPLIVAAKHHQIGVKNARLPVDRINFPAFGAMTNQSGQLALDEIMNPAETPAARERSSQVGSAGTGRAAA
jgi:hypothetical protein